MQSIAGRVEDSRALVEIEFASGQHVEVAVDTGFTGEISLKLDTVLRLGLAGPIGVQTYQLADGSQVNYPVYRGSLRWFGQPIDTSIVVSLVGDELLGMAMLQECVLTVDGPAATVSVRRAP